MHRRLALDDTYHPDDDIRLFFSDKFGQIQLTHPLRSTIPISWPTQETLEILVAKSSGQFIYASTVVKFVESSRHLPTIRLNIILGISPPGRMNPFAELDALYYHLLSSVDDIQVTLRVLSFYVMTPDFACRFCYSSTPLLERFLFLEPGDIQLTLMNLSSIIAYESPGMVYTLHASLVDFLSDKRRSTIFYIDMTSTCNAFSRRIIQYIEGPDGIQAGDIHLLGRAMVLSRWIGKSQPQSDISDILNFDLDAFLNAMIRRQYTVHYTPFGSTIGILVNWKNFLVDAALDDGDRKEAPYRLNKVLESRLQVYQSDWRLQLLLALAGTDGKYGASDCKSLDILLEMDDHNLHLIDRYAFDLRHGDTYLSRLLPWAAEAGLLMTTHMLQQPYIACVSFLILQNIPRKMSVLRWVSFMQNGRARVTRLSGSSVESCHRQILHRNLWNLLTIMISTQQFKRRSLLIAYGMKCAYS